MGIGNIGWTEFLVILAIALIFFGPRRLPGIAQAIGRSLREFQKALNEVKTEISQATRDAETGEDIRRILPRPAELMNAHTDTATPTEKTGGQRADSSDTEHQVGEPSGRKAREEGRRGDEEAAAGPPTETREDEDDRDQDIS